MRVKLKVLQGTSEGKEIAIPVSKFFIGRGEDCHLRPKSDAISRHHCALLITDSQVAIRDFGSKNGTFVNGEAVDSVCILNAGDTIGVGSLEFELVIDHSLGGNKKPKVNDVMDVVQRSSRTETNDDDVSSWLEEALSDDSSNSEDTVTRQFKLEDTGQFDTSDEDTDPEMEAVEDEQLEDSKSGKRKKPKAKKLPERPPTKPQAEDSKEAAADMLRRYFKRS